jgi:hypothetical protein
MEILLHNISEFGPSTMVPLTPRCLTLSDKGPLPLVCPSSRRDYDFDGEAKFLSVLQTIFKWTLTQDKSTMQVFMKCLIQIYLYGYHVL